MQKTDLLGTVISRRSLSPKKDPAGSHEVIAFGRWRRRRRKAIRKDDGRGGEMVSSKERRSQNGVQGRERVPNGKHSLIVMERVIFG
uniref:Uncharacterized protein n=1 Tax=Steinernema glaseri TaxID=37863 RepID=A0A1I8ATL5_9BILA